MKRLAQAGRHVLGEPARLVAGTHLDADQCALAALRIERARTGSAGFFVRGGNNDDEARPGDDAWLAQVDEFVARIKRDALKLAGMSDALPGDRAGLESRFGRALEQLRRTERFYDKYVNVPLTTFTEGNTQIPAEGMLGLRHDSTTEVRPISVSTERVVKTRS